MSENPILSREAFFREGMTHAGRLLGNVLGWSQEQRRVLRPPSALPEAQFLQLCTRCDACVAACPHLALKVGTRSDGVPEGTPFLHDPQSAPCQRCPDTPCITVCEPRALRHWRNES